MRKFQTQLPLEQPEQRGESACPCGTDVSEHIGLDSLGDADVVMMGVPTLRIILKANRDLYAENESLRSAAEQVARRRSTITGRALAGLCVAAGMVIRRRK